MKTLRSILLIAIPFLGMSSIIAQTTNMGTVTDIDGNVYHTVLIGNYRWMAENLRTTSYNNGVEIPCITDSIVWRSLIIGAYCWYQNNEVNGVTYGALYNWYAVNTDRLCPDGWRVPTDNEWIDLEASADTRFGQGDPVWDDQGGRGQDAGLRLKATSGWCSQGNGTDNLGFSALPGGERCSQGRFFVGGKSGFWWSNSGKNDSAAWYRNMIYGLEEIYRNTHPKWMGFSVRCIRDK